MTLDEQIDALRPLTPGVFAALAGYRQGSNQITTMRARGIRVPPERLAALAQRLRDLADKAEGMAG